MLTKALVKELPEHAVYMDVINGGHLLPEKKKYTMRDFKALVNEGYNEVDARWIVICSSMYYHGSDMKGTSAYIVSCDFYNKCALGIALL